MNITLTRGLDIPISGEPSAFIDQGEPIEHVALLGLDYIGLKPSMAVKEGDFVAAGALLFTDKQNPAVKFTAPVSGEILAINRGEKRKFESLVIKRQGDERLTFPTGNDKDEQRDAESIKTLLIDSGLWTSFRARPFGKIPAPSSLPSSLFITAMDSLPLA
ncbi:MAG: NADH:ubiquinone reductase (Na(+)-transporting) subunit A, partial [Desulfobulbaceae bacterium]|nr:NADH:ubiquinone reductase (Na(+)-transporting) subunit A [Desulfobulbaceae bacterium]